MLCHVVHATWCEQIVAVPTISMTDSPKGPSLWPCTEYGAHRAWDHTARPQSHSRSPTGVWQQRGRPQFKKTMRKTEGLLFMLKFLTQLDSNHRVQWLRLIATVPSSPELMKICSNSLWAMYSHHYSHCFGFPMGFPYFNFNITTWHNMTLKWQRLSKSHLGTESHKTTTCNCINKQATN